VRWVDPGSKRRAVEEFDTIEEALDFRAYLRLAKRRGVLEDLTRGEVTLTDFFEAEYWPKDAQRNLQRNTRKTYLPVWYAHLKPRLGHLQLRKLTPPVVQLFREQMEQDGIGAPTIRRAMAILQAVCRYALVKGELTINPVKEVRKPPVRRSLAVVAVSPSQVEELRRLFLDGYLELRAGTDGRTYRVEHRPDIQSATLISLIAYEGLRPEEALALEDRHVGKGTLLIEQKAVDGEFVIGQKTNRPPRSPTLWTPVRKDLAEYQLATRRPTMRDGTQLLLPRADGDLWRDHDYRNWRRRVFKPAVAAARLPITRPYDLRHACASLMIHAGIPLTEIADHIGHSIAVLSRDYAHLIADMRGQPSVPVPDAVMAGRAGRRRQSS
jgi:integrase